MDTYITPKQLSRDLSSTISRELSKAGISQRTAADLADIPLTTLSRRLTGASPFVFTELVVMAQILGTTVSALTALAETAHKRPGWLILCGA